MKEVKNHMKEVDMLYMFDMFDMLFQHTTKTLGFATHADANKFRIDAKEFLITLLEQMIYKNQFSFSIFKYCLVPKNVGEGIHDQAANEKRFRVNNKVLNLNI